MTSSDQSAGGTERCTRCSCKIEDHASVVINRSHRAYICPTAEGHAVSELIM